MSEWKKENLKRGVEKKAREECVKRKGVKSRGKGWEKREGEEGRCTGARVEGKVRKTRVSERGEMEGYKRLKKLIDTSLMFTG